MRMRRLKLTNEQSIGTLFVVPPPVLRPPLKWAGGKRWQVPYLLPIWEKYKNLRLVEPFCGGLAVALGLNPQKARLSDVNLHLINFYNHLKDGLETDGPMKNDEGFYYEARAEFNELARYPDRWHKRKAELFYYLNRTGFNGLCRFNRSGEFNVPFGRYKTINYTRDFLAYRKPFENWDFVCMGFNDIELKKNDFVYADPPYDVDFTSYSAGGFSWDEQVRLAEFLAKHTGPVVLSNQATPRVLKLYAKLEFHLQLLDAPRRISCNGDRQPAKEVLATRNI